MQRCFVSIAYRAASIMQQMVTAAVMSLSRWTHYAYSCGFGYDLGLGIGIRLQLGSVVSSCVPGWCILEVAERVRYRNTRICMSRKPVNSSHSQLVTPIFQWWADRYVFRVVWRVDRSVLGGVWQVDCQCSSHERACLLTYKPKYHCWQSLSHFQSILCYSYRCRTLYRLLNSSGPKCLHRSFLTIYISVQIFLLLLLLLLLLNCFTVWRADCRCSF